MDTSLGKDPSLVDHRHAGTKVLGLVEIMGTQKECFTLVGICVTP